MKKQTFKLDLLEQSGAENTKTLIATFIFPFNRPLYFDKAVTKPKVAAVLHLAYLHFSTKVLRSIFEVII